MTAAAITVASGFAFLEAPRWHDLTAFDLTADGRLSGGASGRNSARGRPSAPSAR